MEGNIPVPVYSAIPSPGFITDMTYASLGAEYEPDLNLPGEDKFVGWTCLEVMTYRRAQSAARGCIDSQKFLYDRTLGKAVQQINQTNVNVTLAEALDVMADKIEKRRPGLLATKGETITIEVVDAPVPITLDSVW
jgi:hypothetical protein